MTGLERNSDIVQVMSKIPLIEVCQYMLVSQHVLCLYLFLAIDLI